MSKIENDINLYNFCASEIILFYRKKYFNDFSRLLSNDNIYL